MKCLIIRHGKTDANRLTRAAFGKQGAPLNAVGQAQAHSITKQLQKMGVNLEVEAVAVSELLRTRQTAEAAGLKNIHAYAVLNEVKSSDPAKTNELIEARNLPTESRTAAQKILANPPKERIWVTHGLIIAALLELLGLPEHPDFIPAFCEILEIEL